MIGRLNHVAIAVPDLGTAIAMYRETLGAQVSEPVELAEHGVRLVFVDLGNSKVELMEPLGDGSPIARFLSESPKGGMHHICYEVTDIREAAARLIASGSRVLGDGTAKIGAHGNPVLFLHPSDFAGTLIELEEVS